MESPAAAAQSWLAPRPNWGLVGPSPQREGSCAGRRALLRLGPGGSGGGSSAFADGRLAVPRRGVRVRRCRATGRATRGRRMRATRLACSRSISSIARNVAASSELPLSAPERTSSGDTGPSGPRIEEVSVLSAPRVLAATMAFRQALCPACRHRRRHARIERTGRLWLGLGLVHDLPVNSDLGSQRRLAPGQSRRRSCLSERGLRHRGHHARQAARCQRNLARQFAFGPLALDAVASESEGRSSDGPTRGKRFTTRRTRSKRFGE